jgi:Acyl-CoA dehydrogenase, C-terminal domain
VLLSGLEYERAATCAAYVGNAQRVVDDAVEYARNRRQFGQPIGSFQVIAHMLADMQTDVDAARLMTYRAAELLAGNASAFREVGMAKLFGSECSSVSPATACRSSAASDTAWSRPCNATSEQPEARPSRMVRRRCSASRSSGR